MLSFSRVSEMSEQQGRALRIVAARRSCNGEVADSIPVVAMSSFFCVAEAEFSPPRGVSSTHTSFPLHDLEISALFTTLRNNWLNFTTPRNNWLNFTTHRNIWLDFFSVIKFKCFTIPRFCQKIQSKFHWLNLLWKWNHDFNRVFRGAYNENRSCAWMYFEYAHSVMIMHNQKCLCREQLLQQACSRYARWWYKNYYFARTQMVDGHINRCIMTYPRNISFTSAGTTGLLKYKFADYPLLAYHRRHNTANHRCTHKRGTFLSISHICIHAHQ